MSREYPSFPVLAVSAAVCDGKSVLLIRRSKAPAKGQWAFPGGAVKLGESPEEALIREVREECHIHVVPEKINRIFSHVIHGRGGKIRFHYIVLNYYCKMMDGTPRPGSDALDIRWAEYRDLRAMDLAEGVSEAVERIFGKEGIP